MRSALLVFSSNSTPMSNATERSWLVDICMSSIVLTFLCVAGLVRYPGRESAEPLSSDSATGLPLETDSVPQSGVEPFPSVRHAIGLVLGGLVNPERLPAFVGQIPNLDLRHGVRVALVAEVDRPRELHLAGSREPRPVNAVLGVAVYPAQFQTFQALPRNDVVRVVVDGLECGSLRLADLHRSLPFSRLLRWIQLYMLESSMSS